MGQLTAGKGIAQTTVTILDGKARLKITHGKFLDANLEMARRPRSAGQKRRHA